MRKRKDTFNKLKTQERENRVNLILDAAERVFETKPFDNVSMQEIADEAGIAKSSIYTYFTNQETLFVEAVTKNVNILIDELQAVHDNAGENSDPKLIIDTFVDFFFQHDAFFRMMTMLMASGNICDESTMKIYDIMRKMLDLLESFFFKNINVDLNHRLLSHALLAFLNGLLVNYRKLPGRSEEDVNRHMKAVGGIVASIISIFNTSKTQ